MLSEEEKKLPEMRLRDENNALKTLIGSNFTIIFMAVTFVVDIVNTE